jgi:pimeloyl-ACP methyl ester carboxylesterase
MSTWASSLVRTERLDMNVWTWGPDDGVPLLLVHGNLVTGGWWRYVAELLPADVRVIAPDMRGFGRTEAKPIDATRGLGDMADDVRALLVTLGLADRASVNAAGWSMGGGVLWQYALAYPGDLASLTQVAPLSPYGWGGVKGLDGTPCFDDYAASGGGTAAPDFVRRLAAGDTSSDEPLSSPRMVIRDYFGPRHNVAEVDEEYLLAETLLTQVGDGFYPGDSTPSPNWPGVAPGDHGVLNTMSPKFFNATGIVDLARKPPVTWVRGGQDQVVSDASVFDLGYLGSLGAVPGWPGDEVLPAQPMAGQTRAILDEYRAKGGVAEEVVLEEAAHGMPVEVPGLVAEAIVRRLVR